MITWIQAHLGVIVAVLSAIVAMDTGLAAIPGVKSNSTYQLVSGLLVKLLKLLSPQAPSA